MSKNLKLSSELREIIVGKLLGDGHLETQNNGKTWKLKIEHNVKQKEYFVHQYHLFSKWVRFYPQVIKKNNSNNYSFKTISTGKLRFYGQQFYKNGKKVVPKLIEKLITSRSLAYWYRDSLTRDCQSKMIVFSTHFFSLLEVKFLIGVLKRKFILDCWPRKKQEGWQIHVSRKSCSWLRELIYPFLISKVFYRISSEPKI